MQCKQCGFLVPRTLRYALMKNSCPSCGSPLFTSKEITEISYLQGRVAAQGFSDGFDELMIYDFALFIQSEIKDALSRHNAEKASYKDSVESASVGDIDLEEIKREIEKEIAPELNSILTEYDESDEHAMTDSKVERLRRIAAQTNMANKRTAEVDMISKKQGSSVRRIE